MARKGKKSAAAAGLEAEARELGKKLDQLMARARKVEAGARVSALQQIRGLQRQQAQAKQALTRLRRQGAAASEPIIAGLHKAWRELGRDHVRGEGRWRRASTAGG